MRSSYATCERAFSSVGQPVANATRHVALQKAKCHEKAAYAPPAPSAGAAAEEEAAPALAPPATTPVDEEAATLAPSAAVLARIPASIALCSAASSFFLAVEAPGSHFPESNHLKQTSSGANLRPLGGDLHDECI